MKGDDGFAHLSRSAMSQVRPRDLAVRFGFGALAGGLSGCIGIAFGARVGGVFLAFPATLLATLTLIEKESTKHDAEDDDVGASLGAAALVAFAVIAWQLLVPIGAPAALAVASAAWLGAAVGLYAVLRSVRAPRQDEQTSRTTASRSSRSCARRDGSSAMSPRSKSSGTRGPA